MKSVRTILAIVVALAAVLLGVAAPAYAAGGGGGCLSDQEIQAEIASGQIQSWPKIKKLAGISAYREVSDVSVCLKGGTPFYQVNVVSPDGEARKIMLNAVNGSR
jgi:uncharacterized membrane protein YkoI